MLTSTVLFLLIQTHFLLSSAQVTYSSGIFLINSNTQYKICGNQVSWDETSNSRIVTAVKSNDFGSKYLWQIVPVISAHKKDVELKALEDGAIAPLLKAFTGETVRCNDTVAFQNVATNDMLYSNLNPSILSKHNTSVVAYSGNNNVERQYFQVMCMTKNATVWDFDEPVLFRHIVSNLFMKTAKKFEFNNQNCPRCPIVGHLEILLGDMTSISPTTTQWKAKKILTIERYESDDDKDDDNYDDDESKTQSTASSKTDEL